MKIIVPVSGGKDSQATLHLAMQQEHEVIPVFYETGWDHPITYHHLEAMMIFYGIKLQKTTYKEAPSMVELVIKKKFWPGEIRFCTERFKMTAFRRWVDTIPGECEVWLGIRKDESWQRGKKYDKYEEQELYIPNDTFPGIYFKKSINNRMRYKFPLLNHTSNDVFRIIEESGFSRNLLYDMGFDRVGCFPCLCAGKKTHDLAYNTPFGRKQYAKIRYIERKIGVKFKYQEQDLTCSICKI